MSDRAVITVTVGPVRLTLAGLDVDLHFPLRIPHDVAPGFVLSPEAAEVLAADIRSQVAEGELPITVEVASSELEAALLGHGSRAVMSVSAKTWAGVPWEKLRAHAGAYPTQILGMPVRVDATMAPGAWRIEP